jgi:[ribosomal protein S18]-alanine N-acetyltransferase
MTNKQNSARIKRISQRDIQRLAQFFTDNDRPEILRHFHPFALNEDSALKICQASHQDLYYVTIWKGQIVGFLMLRGWEDGFEIPSLGVLVDHRTHGKGFGRKMTRFAISKANDKGCPAIRLSVYVSNFRALALYSSLDFREIERKTVDHLGEQDTRLVMIKKLK